MKKTAAPMRRLSISVPSGGVLDVHAAGEFVFVEAASADMALRAESVQRGELVADGVLVRKAAEYRWPGSPFDKLTVTNNGAATATATLWTGEGEASLNTLTGSVEVTNMASTTFDAQADVTLPASSSLDIAADPTIRERILQTPDTNTNQICLRDQSGTPSRGFRLYPDRHIVLANNGALRVRNNSASDQKIHIFNNHA